jgi:hypothetical protein
LLIGSYLFLHMLNPNLVQFQPLQLTKIEKIDLQGADDESHAPHAECNTPYGSDCHPTSPVSVRQSSALSFHVSPLQSITPVAEALVSADNPTYYSGCTPQNIVNEALRTAVLRACIGACHCAWYVSSVLQTARCLPKTEISAPDLYNKLLGYGWKKVPLSQRKYGDVSFWYDPKKGIGHVGIFAGSSPSEEFCVQSAPYNSGGEGSDLSNGIRGWCGDARKPAPHNVGKGSINESARCVQALKTITSNMVEVRENYFAEDASTNLDSCRTPQCIGVFAYCGNLYLRAPGA